MPSVEIEVLIFNTNDEILLIKCVDESTKDEYWTLPKEKMKKGRNIFSNVKLMIKNTINVDVEQLEIVSILDNIDGKSHQVILGIIAYNYEGNISLNKNSVIQEFKFCKLNCLPSNLIVTSMKTLDNYLKNRLYKEEN